MGRSVQEAYPLTGHGVFVAAGQVEHLARHPGQVGRCSHEAVVAIDHHPRAFGPGEGGEAGDPVQNPSRIELDLAGKDQVELTRLGGFQHLVQRHHGQIDPPGLGPAQRLAAKRVELAIAGQHARAFHGQGGNDPHQKIVGVGGKGDCRRIGQSQFAGDVALGFGDDFAEHPVPFVIGQPCRVVPRLDLSGIAGIGPQVVAVRSEMEPVRRGTQRARKQMLVAHSAVRSDHSSGKARLPKVVWR